MSATATVNTLHRDRSREVPAWFGVLVVLMLWLLARPYVGLRHDGVLYAGQALLHLAPAAMSHDIFFVNGSQDKFSVVSPLLAAMYSRWGLDLVQIVLPAICQVALLVVVMFLLRPLPALERWLGLVALAVLSHVYGGFGIFSFGERFVTGRTLAEPLALAALALLLYDRRAWAALAGLVAAALHPLVALPALVVGWLLLIHRDRRWLWAGLLALVPLSLAWAGRPPFDGLLSTYDDDWWRLVEMANGQVLISRWGIVDWQIVALDLGALVAASVMLPSPLHRLTKAVAITAVALLVVSAVGADALRNVLITQLQLWRVLWLAHLLSLACLPALVWRLWHRGACGQLACLALGTAVVAVNGLWEQGWVFLLWSAATLLLPRLGKPLRPPVLRLAKATTLMALLGLSLVLAAGNADALRSYHGALDAPNWLLLAFTMPALSLPLAGALFTAWGRGQASALLALIVTIFGLLCAVTTWDRRTAWTRYIEAGLQREHPFAASIPETAQVYWHENLPATWLMLRRASYMSDAQGAGLLFNRETALEFGRRRDEFSPLELQARVCSIMAVLNGEAHDREDCTPTEAVVERLCTIDRGPDFMIFERRLPRGVIASWTFSAADEASHTYYLYDCQHFR